MKTSLLTVACFGLVGLLSSAVKADNITAARYVQPTSRYGHFALGQPHEYARITATTNRGRVLELGLPEDEVFEDLTPRLVRMGKGEATEILTIVSRRADGARLVLLQMQGDQLVVSAQTPPVGTPMRWLNPVGVADLDGDGRAEVAMVSTPHIGGVLRVFKKVGQQLVEVAQGAGFSNHVYGSTELGLSSTAVFQGRMHLWVPAFGLRQIRIMRLEGKRLMETARCALPAQIAGAIEGVSDTALSIVLSTGRHAVSLDTCTPS